MTKPTKEVYSDHCEDIIASANQIHDSVTCFHGCKLLEEDIEKLNRIGKASNLIEELAKEVLASVDSY